MVNSVSPVNGDKIFKLVHILIKIFKLLYTHPEKKQISK